MSVSWLQRVWKRRLTRGTPARRPAGSVLRVEALEGRELLSVAGEPVRLAADLNGDRRTDVVLLRADASGALVGNILLARGDGTYTESIRTVDTDSSWLANPVLAGDVNGDGKTDLIFQKQDPQRGLVTDVKLSAGDGTFRDKVQVQGDATAALKVGALVADVNGDRKADLVYWGSSKVKLSAGDGTFKSVVLGVPANTPAPFLIGDLNGDGKADFLTYSYLPDVWHLGMFGLSTTALLSKGDGTFTAVSQKHGDPGGAPKQPFVLRLADLDGDGKADLFYQSTLSNLVPKAGAELSNGDGTFRPTNRFGWDFAHGTIVAAADVTGSKRQAVVFQRQDKDDGLTTIVWKFTPPSTFAKQVQVIGGDAGWTQAAPLVGDVTGDGKVDLVYQALDPERGLVQRTLAAQGDGTWRPADTVAYADLTSVALVDGSLSLRVPWTTVVTATGVRGATVVRNGSVTRVGAQPVTAGGGRLYYLTGDGVLHDGAGNRPGTRDYTVAGDGTVYALGSDGRLQRRGATGAWQDVASRVIRYAVTADGTCYALDTDGVLWVNGANGGSARDLARGSDGSVYVLTQSGALRQLAPGGSFWQTVATNVVKFVVDTDGTVYSLRTDSYLYINRNMSLPDTQDIARGADGSIYWLGNGGVLGYALKRRDPATGAWLNLMPNVSKVALTDTGTWYALGRGGSLADGTGGLKGDVQDFGLLPDGTAVALSTDGSVLQKTAAGWQTVSAGFKKLAVGPFGQVYTLAGDGRLFAGDDTSWTNTADFTLGPTGTLYRLDTDGLLQRQTASGWQNLATGVTRYALAYDGTCYALGGGVLTADGAPVAGDTADFAVSPRGTLYRLGTDGVLRSRDGAGWRDVDRGVASFVLGRDGTCYRLVGTTLTDGAGLNRTGIKQLSIDDGALYALQADGVMTRSTDGKAWESLDRNVQSYTLTDGLLDMAAGTGDAATGDLTAVRGAFRGILDPSREALPRVFLDCVGKVVAGGSMGTGTLLAQGANYFVLTAKHVVKGASSITFQVTVGAPPDSWSATYRVIKVILHPDLDLALLEIDRKTNDPLRNVQGAVLPRFSGPTPVQGTRVVELGYGYSGDGWNGESANAPPGARRYGFTTVDLVKDGLLYYRYDKGESAFARGDSGGPDFTFIRRQLKHGQDAGKVVFVPILGGVHNFIARYDKNGNMQKIDERPDGTLDVRYGDWMASQAVTPAVEKWIHDNARPF